MLQRHIVPGADAWNSEGLTEELYQTYDLAFLEMLDGTDELDAQQVAALKDRLSSEGQKVVLMYIHGWNNNAAWGNPDLARFRTILGYMRSFLNSRCVGDRETYCGTQLIGVYGGWRGNEFHGLLRKYSDLISRKSQSESLAIGPNALLPKAISIIEAALHLDTQSTSADKFMIYGHSLGGNMLVTAVSNEAKTAALNHSIDGETHLSPIAGDLVVLLNPATEAVKWNDIQRAERTRAGFSDDFQNPMYISQANVSEYGDAVEAWRTQYPITQRPVLISITATKNWNRYEDLDGNEDADLATGVLFPLFSWSRSPQIFFREREDLMAIGHLHPRFVPGHRRRIERRSRALGASHDITTLSGICTSGSEDCLFEERTRYRNAGNPDAAWCQTATGGLLQARRAAKERHGLYPANWDWRQDVGGNRNDAQMQFRQQLALNEPNLFRSDPDRGLMYASMAPPTTPFWAMRAPDNTAFDHGAIYSYPMWCGLAQIWLDRITD